MSADDRTGFHVVSTPTLDSGFQPAAVSQLKRGAPILSGPASKKVRMLEPIHTYFRDSTSRKMEVPQVQKRKPEKDILVLRPRNTDSSKPGVERQEPNLARPQVTVPLCPHGIPGRCRICRLRVGMRAQHNCQIGTALTLQQLHPLFHQIVYRHYLFPLESVNLPHPTQIGNTSRRQEQSQSLICVAIVRI